MPERFLDKHMTKTKLLRQIRDTDMAEFVLTLSQQFRMRDQTLEPDQYRAVMVATVNCQSSSFLLYANRVGNLEVRFPSRIKPQDWLYSLPGSVVLFALPGHSYSVTRYAIDGDALCPGETLLIDAQTPQWFDGEKYLYSFEEALDLDTCVLAFNFPDASRDIAIFCKRTLKRRSWLASSGTSQRFLVGLDALSAVGDPGMSSVAQALIHHPHFAVQSAASQILKAGSGAVDSVTTPDMTVERFLGCIDAYLVDGDSTRLLADLGQLARCRSLLSEHLLARIDESGFDQADELYNAYAFTLYESERCMIRLVFWAPVESQEEADTFIYGLNHSHDFEMFVVGYCGDGYETIVRPIMGADSPRWGVRTEFGAARTIKVAPGIGYHMRPFRDAHLQMPPQTLSASLSVLVYPAEEGTEGGWSFDDDHFPRYGGLGDEEAQLYAQGMQILERLCSRSS